MKVVPGNKHHGNSHPDVQLPHFMEEVAQQSIESLKTVSLHDADAFWAAAFSRHKGYFTFADQSKLRDTTVAIVGLGSVGGTVFLGLVRAGVGSFVLADADRFEAANINRQNGAQSDTLGRFKIEVLVEEALRINPFIKINTFSEGVTVENVHAILEGVDIVVDAMDIFSYRERLSLLVKCREKNLFVVTSGNAGFGASLLIFDPKGMDLTKFLGVSLESSDLDVMAAFALTWIPRHFSGAYTDPCYVSLEAKIGPATGVASLVAGSLIIAEIIRITLKQPGIMPVPHYVQLDFHERKYFKGVLRRGNKSLWQRIRRYVLINRYWGKKKGFKPFPPPEVAQNRVTTLPVPEAVIRAILTAGIQAPSGDNSQPWVFEVKDEKIIVKIDHKNEHSYFDYLKIPSLISSGAVLENIRIAASFYGLEAVVDTVGEGDDHHIASIHFALSNAAQDPLFNAIWERNTNRRIFNKQPLPSELADTLRQTALSFPGVGWHEITNKKQLRRLAQAALLVDILRSERRDLHVHLQSKLRFTEQDVYKKRDGFPIRNLKAGPEGELFLKISHRWNIMKVLNRFGFSYAAAYFSYKEIASAESVVLLTAAGLSHRDCIIVGQAFERVWLEATRHDLAFHPMAALPIFLLRKKLGDDEKLTPRHKKILAKAEAIEREVFPELNANTENQLIMFRLGYAKSVEVGTLRKPLDSFIESFE